MIHSTDELRVVPLSGSTDVLTEVFRAGAQKLLAQAVEAEVAAWIEQHRHCIDAEGHREVVRNGHLPVRTFTNGVGPVPLSLELLRFSEILQRIHRNDAVAKPGANSKKCACFGPVVTYDLVGGALQLLETVREKIVLSRGIFSHLIAGVLAITDSCRILRTRRLSTFTFVR